MRAVYNALVAAAGISILAACTGGQSGIEPPSTPVNVQNTTALQFRVGTYRTSGGSVFFNTLVTYRQANGFSGTLYNTPTITGPAAGFVVPSVAAAGTDGGTNHISGTPPTQPGTPAVATTFAQVGGAFAYGFAPANTTTAGTANYINALGLGTGGGFGCNICNANGFALYNEYSDPFLVASSGSRTPFILGPPAVPDFHNGTFPNGFLGYDSGFVAFAVPNPPAGAYNLHLTVPSATIGVNSAVFDAPATLTNATPLAAEAVAPVITPTAGGGASFTVAPAPAGVTNQLLYIVDINSSTGTPTFYTFNAGAAGGTFALSSTSGPTSPQGVHGPPFTTGDHVYAYVAGSDYDILAAAPPLNTQQLPTLPGQADVTIGPIGQPPNPCPGTGPPPVLACY